MRLVGGASAVRAALLRHFFARPGVEDHVRAAARAVGHDPTAVARELDRLERAGVLTSVRRGGLRIYRLAPGPVVDELRPLVQRTVGVEGRLAQALEGLGAIREAFIFGSYAGGTDSAASDVDLMVVGEPDAEELWDRVLAAERDLGRAVNVTEYTAREFDALKRKRDPFITSVLAGRVIPLIGRARG